MSVLRKTVGTALSGGAQVLSVASKLMETTAKTLRPSPSSPPSPREEDSRREAVATPPRDASSTAEVIDAVEEQVPQVGRKVEPAKTPMLDETPHVRTSETHIEELADQSAADVIAAVGDLSTDELRLLTEHELAHKNRKTVLSAIEKALTPEPSGSSGNGSSGGSSTGGGGTRGQQREIVLPEAGGVPTSGKMQPGKGR